jgi:long-subunit fatty acid transport protein
MTLFVAALLSPGGAAAQTSLQIPLQFDFLNPGAKSKAMGGAFVGLADDATAAFVNPAGLILMTRPELSFEGRYSRIDTLFLQRGRLSGALINEGTDTISGPVFGETSGSDTGPAFLSGVYTHPSLKWSLAGYRHELVRVDQQFLSDGVFQQSPEEFTSRRDSPQQGIRTVSITGYGAAVGYRLAREVSLGAGVTAYSFRLNSQFRRFDTVGFLGPPNLNAEIGRSTQTGDDHALTPTVGALFGLSTRGRIGVMFRQGASFVFRTKDGNDPERQGRFRVPNTLAIGASFRPATMWTVAGEVTHVQYSRLDQDFVTDQARFIGRQADFAIHSGTEVHFGAQYLPTLSHGAPKLRGGVWYDPNHSVQFNPSVPSTTIFDRLFDERLSTALSTGKALVHYTGGLGLSLSSRFEINGSFDVTSQSRVFAASCVIR